MPLTTGQRDYVRNATGDYRTDNASAYDLSNDALDAIYDDAAQGNSNTTLTIVWALRLRWGKAINAVAQTSAETGFTAQHNQKQEQIKKLLDYWEGMAGLSGGQSLGSEVTHPYRKDSRATEAPTYPYGTDSDDDRHITIYY